MVSAAFMLQIRNWLFKFFGDFIVITCFKALFISLAVLTIIYSFKIRSSIFKVCVTACIFVLAYFFSVQQPFFSEKTHVLTYGLLGYLASNDLIDNRSGLQLKNIAMAVAFASFVSAADELFQGILPYRFAEFRDFITNIISASMGIILSVTLHR